MSEIAMIDDFEEFERAQLAAFVQDANALKSVGFAAYPKRVGERYVAMCQTVLAAYVTKLEEDGMSEADIAAGVEQHQRKFQAYGDRMREFISAIFVDMAAPIITQIRPVVEARFGRPLTKAEIDIIAGAATEHIGSGRSFNNG